jgi:hypothetical protein
LSEFGIIVDIDLGINAVNFVLGIDGPWVDFELGGVTLVEEVIQVSNLFSVTLDVFQVEFFFQLIQEFLSDTLIDFDGEYFDLFWVVFSNLFDFNTSFCRTDDGWSLAVSVQNEGEVDLSDNINTFVDEYCIYLESFFGSLMGDQIITNHLFCFFLDFLGGFEDLNTALHSGCEVTWVKISNYLFLCRRLGLGL